MTEQEWKEMAEASEILVQQNKAIGNYMPKLTDEKFKAMFEALAKEILRRQLAQIRRERLKTIIYVWQEEGEE